MKKPRYAWFSTAAIRIRPARPPGTMATFSHVYWLGFPFRWCSLYMRATASRSGLIPAVGAYSLEATVMSMCVGRWKQPSMSSSTYAALVFSACFSCTTFVLRDKSPAEHANSVPIKLTSGAPWPRFAHSSGSSKKPNSPALSVHQTTPVDDREGSRPAWGRCPLRCFNQIRGPSSVE